ncbi:MAG: hypothetical protein A2284_05790, partial [Deltaproteobacteria bacterium RIFOXYA12_FULL_61_11]
VVIGGGITGAGVARDAAMRGLSTLLVEKGDLASGTSSRSGKLVHGGLRYLRYANFKLVYESANERNCLRDVVAPHLVRPERMVVPTYRDGRYSRNLQVTGLFLYGAMTLFRNANHFEILSNKELEQDVPGLRRGDTRGAVAFYDCRTMDTRLTVDTVKSAVEAGAEVGTYCELLSLEFSRGGKGGRAILLDRLDGGRHEVEALAFVNATGVWGDELLARAGARERFNLKKSCGVHAVVRRERLGHDFSVSVESFVDKRFLYLMPWGEHTLIGTTDAYYSGHPDQVVPRAADLDYLLEAVNWHFPRARLSRADVTCCYAGLRPLVTQEDVPEERASRDYELAVDPRGLVSITGGKLTTYRLMARKVVDLLVRRFFAHRRLPRCLTRSPISGGLPLYLPRHSRVSLSRRFDLDPEVLEHLISRYGSNYQELLALIEGDPSLAERLRPDRPYCLAELSYQVEREYVECLDDLLQRRTTLFWFTDDNGLAVAEKVAARLAALLGWDARRKEAELERYRVKVAQARP